MVDDLSFLLGGMILTCSYLALEQIPSTDGAITATPQWSETKPKPVQNLDYDDALIGEVLFSDSVSSPQFTEHRRQIH